MTTDDTTIPVPRHLIEALVTHWPAGYECPCETPTWGEAEDASEVVTAIVALLPPPKRWTDEDVRLMNKTIDRWRLHKDFVHTVNWKELAVAVLTALDEAGRLAPLEEQ